MEDFFQEKPRKKKASAFVFRGYRRLFALAFAVAVLWQTVSFLQMRLSAYHEALVNDFRVVMSVTRDLDNAALAAVGESLNQKEDVSAVELFSPQDGLKALQSQNPRLAQALVALGREQMPAYFELTLNERAIGNIRPFVQNLSAEYPQLSAKYSAAQADMAFYSGLCLRTVNLSAAFALVLFFAFMFMVEAHPARGNAHAAAGAVSALLAGALSLAFLAALTYPTGFLSAAFKEFTSPERQVCLLAFCGLFGWTLSKWQKF